MDGEIIIGTELSTSKFDKQIKNLENKLEKATERLDRQEIDLEIKFSNIDNAKKDMQQVYEEMTRVKKESEELNKTISVKKGQYDKLKEMISSGQNIGPEGHSRYGSLGNQLTNLYKQQAEINNEMDKYNQKYNKLNDNLTKAEGQYEKQKIQVEETKREITNINTELDIMNAKASQPTKINFKGMVDDIGKSVEKVTRKISRWALAVFGLRSAYMAVRNAINIISQDDKQLAADINYIKTALAYSLEPVVRAVVDLVKKLLEYLGYIIHSWTGKNIFENANKNLKKSVGSAKELKKQLAGFDEMNILQDTSSSSGGGGDVAPSMDLSKLSGEPPWWVKILADPSSLPGLAGLLTFLKVAPKLIEKFGTQLGIIKGLGIATAVSGIVMSVQALLAYLKEPTWENFGGILEGLGVAILGLGIYTGNLPLIVSGAVMVILGLVAKLWDKIKRYIDEFMEKIYTVGDDLMNFFTSDFEILSNLIAVVIGTITGTITEWIRLIRDRFDSFFGFIRGILDGIILIFKGEFKEGIISIAKSLVNRLIGMLNTIINAINLLVSPLRAIITVVGKVLGKDWTMEDVRIPNIPKLARGGIVHNPGPGVLMGSYIAGEGSSPEAVLPLDDNTLDRLGESIARHMTINANIYNTMNGRVISRELKRINNENDFAYNG